MCFREMRSGSQRLAVTIVEIIFLKSVNDKCCNVFNIVLDSTDVPMDRISNTSMVFLNVQKAYELSRAFSAYIIDYLVV